MVGSRLGALVKLSSHCFFCVQFEITFECIEDLPEDLEWKIIYVGSAESEEYDQVLDTVYVGPVPEGRHKFVFQVRIKLMVAVSVMEH